jgi:N-methylhydantoinase A
VQGVAADAIRTVVELDVRYAGQSFDLTVALGDDVATVAEAFHARHERRYGYAVRDEQVELATVRVTAFGSGGTAPGGTVVDAVVRSDARLGTRDAWDDGRFVSATVYAREKLGRGARIAGPAIVEQYDTTTWLPAAWQAKVDAHDNLLLERA